MPTLVVAPHIGSCCRRGGAALTSRAVFNRLLGGCESRFIKWTLAAGAGCPNLAMKDIKDTPPASATEGQTAGQMNPAAYKCPKCGGTKFTRWALPHPLILHWILNPGVAFNEIVLGQRLPKIQLICEDCDSSLIERSYVPCPSCREMHLGRLASGKRGFGNWRGLACPSCKEPIPCIWNVFSLLILGVTFPLWFLPYFLHFRNQPLRPLFQLEDGKPPTVKAPTTKKWIFMGAAWGSLMWLFMSALPLLTESDRTSGRRVAIVATLIGLPLWTLGGLAFGFLMWFFLGRTGKKKGHGEQDRVY